MKIKNSEQMLIVKEKPQWQQLSFVVPIQNTVTREEGFFIRGIAINETTTRNNTKFVAEELKKSARTLKGKPILKDHNASVDSIVGRVTDNVKFNTTSKAIEFEGLIEDADMQNKITKGLITNVSVGAFVKDFDKDDDGVVTVKGIQFVELSLVAIPADPNAGFARACFESFSMKQDVEVQEALFQTSRDSTDGHVHRVQLEDSGSSGTTGRAGTPPHTHTVTDGKVLPKDLGTYTSRHPGALKEVEESYEDTQEEMFKMSKEKEISEENKMEEKYDALKQEFESFKQEQLEKEVAVKKAEEEARIADLENKAKLAEDLQKQVEELKAVNETVKADVAEEVTEKVAEEIVKKVESEAKVDKTVGEVGQPTETAESTKYDGVLIGTDTEALCRGTIITRESYPSHLKRLQWNKDNY